MTSQSASEYLAALDINVSADQVLNLIRHGRLRATRAGDSVVSPYDIATVELLRMSSLRRMSRNPLSDVERDIVWVGAACTFLQERVDWSDICGVSILWPAGLVPASLICGPLDIEFGMFRTSSRTAAANSNSLVISDFFDKSTWEPLHLLGFRTLSLACTIDADVTYSADRVAKKVAFPW